MIARLRESEKGTALVMSLLALALLLALAMGISLTASSELGVSNTYANQTLAFQAAEAGLNHAISLVTNFTGGDFTSLLKLRGDVTQARFPNNVFDPLRAPAAFYQAFDWSGDPAKAGQFAAGVEMIPASGRQLVDASGEPVPNAFYRVCIIDDEPPSRASSTNPTVPNFNPPATASWIESSSNDSSATPYNTDGNQRIVIYSVGNYGSASAIIEGWVGYLPYPALITNDDVRVWGNSQVIGTYGGVHSNSNLDIGASAWIQQTATAAGTVNGADPNHVGGFYGGGQPVIDVPKFVTQDPVTPGGPPTSPRLQDYLIRQADIILVDPRFAENGAALQSLAERLNVSLASLQVALDQDSSRPGVQQSNPAAVQITRDITGNGMALSIPLSNTGWEYSSQNWNIKNTSANGHTFYIVGEDKYKLSNPSSSQPNGGNVKITGNVGTNANPLQVTVLATGSIDVEGNPNLVANLRKLNTPELPPFVKVDVLFAAVEDVSIRGDAEVPRFSGIIYAGEQIDLSGNGSFNGQVISYGNSNVNGSLVNSETNTITGSFVLEFSEGRTAFGRVKLLSWRQIKK
jgi:hypothetical protein